MARKAIRTELWIEHGIEFLFQHYFLYFIVETVQTLKQYCNAGSCYIVYFIDYFYLVLFNLKNNFFVLHLLSEYDISSKILE